MKPKLFISSFKKINDLKTKSRFIINKKPLIHCISSSDLKINKSNLNFKKKFINFFGKTKEGFSKFSNVKKNINKISESKEEEKIYFNESIYSEDNNNDNSSKKSNDIIKKNSSDNSENDIEENTDNEEEEKVKSKDTINFSRYDFDEKGEKDEFESEEQKSKISGEENEEDEENSEKSKISNDEYKEDSSYITKKEKSVIVTESDNKSKISKISNSIKNDETEEENESDEDDEKEDESNDSEEESFPDYEDSDISKSSSKIEDNDTEEKEEEEDYEDDNDTESSMTKKTKYKKHKKRKISSDYSSDSITSEDEYNDDPIKKLYNKLYKKGLTYSISKIYDKNHNLIGKRILKLNYDLNSSKLNWIKAYHGTKYEFLESIFTNGLKKPGEIINNNKKVKPRKGHIDFGNTFYDIKNWAKAIFVSPSIFYSSCSCYSEKIISNGKKWRIVVEVKVKPDSFSSYDSTINNYHFLKNEPKKIEYRIDKKKNVYVYSILFVNDNYLKKVKKYQDGFVFY